ncbi:hypothetical protein CDAR_288211 [Caerostris darwini]|uniref:CLLAC-motif containing domain-containing protein n=1 Tax=Caerostris darwini TaxID=1538125 RepID=A0AAV4WC99_9ARAC|nr:hypothetical protein CDAR_288211 [Caerostris darwini]
MDHGLPRAVPNVQNAGGRRFTLLNMRMAQLADDHCCRCGRHILYDHDCCAPKTSHEWFMVCLKWLMAIFIAVALGVAVVFMSLAFRPSGAVTNSTEIDTVANSTMDASVVNSTVIAPVVDSTTLPSRMSAPVSSCLRLVAENGYKCTSYSY